MPSPTDHVWMLKAIGELPFSVGKRLLFDILRGDASESVRKHAFQRLQSFGALAYDERELDALLDRLLLNGMIESVPLPSNRFVKVLKITERGRAEITSPTLHEKKASLTYTLCSPVITDEDHRIFSALDFFLGSYDDAQKKAIISPAKSILCIAGAGSGKTTVLTKRIEYLATYKSVPPDRILAVTFTRKAREEMMSRLKNLPVHVETFNSFCEKILKRYGSRIYERSVRVISAREKMQLLLAALARHGLTMEQALDVYFSSIQRRQKTDEVLAWTLLHDCFFILDYFKARNEPLDDFSRGAPKDEAARAKAIFDICIDMDERMKVSGLRDYTDQIMDALRLFKRFPDLVPSFDHVLVDEYQDVNSSQIELLDLLRAPNIFCVGDPRQSIFGWRGSKIGYILSFPEKYPDAEIVCLTKNYRSAQKIVDLMNQSIAPMRLPDLEGRGIMQSRVDLQKCSDDADEMNTVVQEVAGSKDVSLFVLARTNRQLLDLSAVLRMRGIGHALRTEDVRSTVLTKESNVTLATIHAIKGMEAMRVIVMGCTSQNFPCKAQDHPVVSMVKIDDYDREEEERRLFYVAISRAKESLLLTYTGNNLTKYITPEMLRMIGKTPHAASQNQVKISATASGDLLRRLKEWRLLLAKTHRIAPYMILHDRTLMEIADSKPSTSEELMAIQGMGPVKVQRYGDSILKIIHGV